MTGWGCRGVVEFLCSNPTQTLIELGYFRYLLSPNSRVLLWIAKMVLSHILEIILFVNSLSYEPPLMNPSYLMTDIIFSMGRLSSHTNFLVVTHESPSSTYPQKRVATMTFHKASKEPRSRKEAEVVVHTVY